MPFIIDNEEYLTTAEACEYLGGISSLTLRNRTKAAGIVSYKQGFSRNVYYKKSDLDQLKALRPNLRDEEDNGE